MFLEFFFGGRIFLIYFGFLGVCFGFFVFVVLVVGVFLSLDL